jgi:hypothetical protein
MMMRLALWGIVLIYLGAIFLTFSRGGFLALFSVIALIGWKQKSLVIRAGMLAAIVLGIVVIGMSWKRS